MAKKKRTFKNVRTLYYLHQKGICDVVMKGTKSTSKQRIVKDIRCNGLEISNVGKDDYIGATKSDTMVVFLKPQTCSLRPISKKILCPP